MAAAFIMIAIIAERLYLGAPIPDAYLVLAILLAVTVLLTHRQNIKRLIKGEENKFGQKVGKL
jgi:glycerol-3-phosphate acyltransferase PlsY